MFGSIAHGTDLFNASIRIGIEVFGDAEDVGNIFKNVGTALDLESAPNGCTLRANWFIIMLQAFFSGYGGFRGWKRRWRQLKICDKDP